MAKKTSRPNKKITTNTYKSKLITAIIIGIILLIGLAIWAFCQHRTTTPNPTPAPSTTASASPIPTATATPSATPTPSPVASAGEGECANLSGSLDSTGGGTAGTIYRQVVLTNESTQTCTVYGFPGVSLINVSGTQLGSPATRDGAAGATITLAPGQSAAAPVGFPEAGNFAPNICSSTSTSLKVYPPNQTIALTIPLAAQYCPGFSVQTLVAH